MVKFEEILEELQRTNTQLVLVSKTKPVALIEKYYNLGQRHFGENRVQELVQKHDILPKDIKWHQIGHLQKNKVKYIAPFVHLIHAVDSLELLEEINKRAKANNRIIDILLQIKIATEDSKFGLSKKECINLLSNNTVKSLANIRIVGLMGMATYTSNKNQIKEEFKALKDFLSFIKENHFQNKNYFKELSMGMSGDYKIAIEEEATLVRIGSLIVGSR